MEVLYPRGSLLQDRIMQTIREIKAGRLGRAGEETLLEAAGSLAGRGRVYDAAQVLAEAIVRTASRDVRRPSPPGGPGPG